MTKVSILVPIYNVEKFLTRCINSLLEQTYPNIEYVFVNDASTDRSLEILEDIVDKSPRKESVSIVRSEKNGGIVVSRNKLLDRAIGDYFLFVDSDDYIDKTMIEEMVKAAEKNNADIVGCDYTEEYDENTRTVFPQHYPTERIAWMKAITRLDIKGVLWKLLMRRSMIEAHHMRFVPEVELAEDYIFCCKAFYYAKRIASVNKAFYHYVKYNPMCATQITPSNIEYQAKAMNIIERFYKENGINENLKEDLLFRKFILKLPYLTNKNCYNPKAWRNLFPESNKAYDKIPLPYLLRIKIQIAASPCYWILHAI